ncbi:hypothetical protein ACM614_08295 [Streptomyces sp. 12297]|uniref:hypothetical protein n=1 Tax=Streptomyces sp. NBC_00239 TaxID=2903640 RepID=UPI002E2C564F|nr:hypothetical protein [Streptomyces sp. NBC_00239]
MGVFAWFRRKAKDAVEAAAEETSAPAPAEEPQAVGAEATTAREVTATEGVEIPKQQSADEAADSETGEGART